MLDALDALQGAGHTRIGFIGGIGAIMGLHNQPEDIRTLAFTDWSRRLHLDNDALIYASGPFTVDNGRALAERMLAQHSPTHCPMRLWWRPTRWLLARCRHLPRPACACRTTWPW